jgi:hypothetical protein
VIRAALCFLLRGAAAVETKEELPEGSRISWDKERSAKNGDGGTTLFVRTNIRATSVGGKPAPGKYLWVKFIDLEQAL